MKSTLTKPEVSIITPSYNCAKYIKESIGSVLKQTYKNWELIIINDGSTDETEQLVKPFLKDTRIRYFTNKKNAGVIESSNKGIGLSRSNLIARLDSDDIWLDNKKLEKQIDYLLKNPETVVIGSWGYKLDSNGSKSVKIKYPVSNNEIKKYLLIEDCFLNSSVVFRKDKFLQVGRYENRFKSAEDYALWLKLGQTGKFHNLPQYMAGYRTNERGISMTHYNQQITNTIKAVREYHRGYPFYFLAIPLWYLRIVIPRRLRENLSGLFREFILNIYKSRFFSGFNN